jgi:hypothetical protein
VPSVTPTLAPVNRHSGPLFAAADTSSGWQRYALVEKSILVVTEGLGPRSFHGHVVLLVNELTASVGEMVSAFLRHFPGTIHPGSFEVAQARNAI